EPALADAGLADEEEQPAAPGERVVESGDELGELRLAPDKAAGGVGVENPCRGKIERRILVQNRLAEVAQLARRLDAEFLDERPACLLVGLAPLCLPTGAVERQPQLG